MRQRWALGLILLGWTAAAQAHLRAGEAAGFLSGLEHPLSGLDHIVAMVSVGLWAAQLGAPAIWLLPVTFPLVMAVGGFLGRSVSPCPGSRWASPPQPWCSAQPCCSRRARRSR